MITEIVLPYSLKKKLKSFPGYVRKKFYRCVDMLMENQNHPSLRHKKIQGTDAYWEFSITMNYRCIYRREANKAFIVAVDVYEDVF